MGNPVVHWEIGAPESKRSQEFYSQMFGWTITCNNPMNYGSVNTGGQGGINGGIMQTPDGHPKYITIYVQVDDLQASLDKVARLGGKTLVPPTPIPGTGAFAWFQDPDGLCVGLFKPA
jgi:predicted enzyme related to lactoylglutathione lyase